MVNAQLAAEWRSRTHAQRVDLLKRLHTVNIKLTAERLGIEVHELDAVAEEAGLVPVRVTVVDVAGQSDWDYGVVGPNFAAECRPRKFHHLAAKAA